MVTQLDDQGARKAVERNPVSRPVGRQGILWHARKIAEMPLRGGHLRCNARLYDLPANTPPKA